MLKIIINYALKLTKQITQTKIRQLKLTIYKTQQSQISKELLEMESDMSDFL
jgi:hypothetical protein